MAIFHWQLHLVVKNYNLHIATDIQWFRMTILHWQYHVLVKNGNFTLEMTSSCQELQFHIANDI